MCAVSISFDSNTNAIRCLQPGSCSHNFGIPITAESGGSGVSAATSLKPGLNREELLDSVRALKDLQQLEIVYPEGLDHVGEGQWVEILFTMDSGAMDPVVGKTTCPEIPLQD